MTLVVASHLPGETPFSSTRWEVKAVLCKEDFDYANGLVDAWSTERTVVNVEHDIQVNDDLIAALVGCPEPLCAWAYLVHAASGIHDAPAYPYCATQPGPWITEGAEWAAWGAPGFAKFTPRARTSPLQTRHWMGVEASVNHAVQPTRWHIHWPAVEHYHQ